MVKRSQVAIEYVVIIAFVLMLTVAMLSTMVDQSAEINDNNVRLLLSELKEIVASNVRLAVAAEDGYSTVFAVPSQVHGYNVSYMMEADILAITYMGKEDIMFLHNGSIGGCINKTRDDLRYLMKIEKEDGVVVLSSCLDCNISYKQCYDINVSNACSTQPGSIRSECQMRHCLCN